MAVSASKVVMCPWLPLAFISSTWGFTFSTAWAKSSAEISAPSICTLSLKVWRCGEVNSPIRYPAFRSTDDIIAAVLPFPFVPATCTIPSPDSGEPKRRSSSLTLSRSTFPGEYNSFKDFS